MSANSPRHVMRSVPIVVPPQPVSDRSIYDSVAGFIDVALANTPQSDSKDAILWTKFENSADISDLCYGDDWDLEGSAPPPLLLVLGYVTGIQVWAIPANGEAFEVLSWRHGSVKALRILPTPLLCDTDMADEPVDQFAHKRPLMAICDSSGVMGNASGSSTNANQHCAINFVSLKSKDLVKSIKFTNPIIEILANRSSIAVTFPEKVAIFDARTLDDRLTITACNLSPGLNSNPIALGTRWMAYAERRLIPSKRSSGGCDYDGVASYTATVLNAAKSLGKGLRELGETVAAGFSGNNQGFSSNFAGTSSQLPGDKKQAGIVTILDIKYPITDSSPVSGAPVSPNGDDKIIAHFVAHSDPIVSLSFDHSGMLLVSADKRGHDFHVFRVHPHPGGPSMATVHHLYVLHRGDTTSKVQDLCFSLDSRWIAVSTLRGTTHVFPITPYGGPAGMRTHGSSHVVNRLSRFHRSAGLSIDSRSSSPISLSDISLTQTTSAYPNPRTPPFPHPTVVGPLAQLRQPINVGTGPGATPGYTKGGQGRQRLSSYSEEGSKPLRMCATFARPRAWLVDGATPRDSSLNKINKITDSLFVMTAFGSMMQYDLDPRPISNIPKEKVCDDTPIELGIDAKAQWNLLRHDDSIEIQPPLPQDNILLKERLIDGLSSYASNHERNDERDDVWLSQVEIITHAGPHRRLWMGPQFMFKTYNTPSGSSLSGIDAEAIEIGVGAASPNNRTARSNPVNMPSATPANRSGVSVLIESSSYSSIEQSPRMSQIHYESENTFAIGSGENQLREDLADAMKEASGVALLEGGSKKSSTVSTTGSKLLPATASVSSGIATATMTTAARPTVTSIAKVVNPLGTVTTLVNNDWDNNDDNLVKNAISDHYLHENCDEALFRPVVTVISGLTSPVDIKSFERPAPMGLDLIVPVIERQPSLSPVSKDKAKENKKKEHEILKREEIEKFEELSAQNQRKNNKKPAQEESSASSSSVVVVEAPKVMKSKIEKPCKSPAPEVTVKLPTKREPAAKTDANLQMETRRSKKDKTPPPPPVVINMDEEEIESDVSVVISLPVKPKKRSSKFEKAAEELIADEPVKKLSTPPPVIFSQEIDCTEYVTVPKYIPKPKKSSSKLSKKSEAPILVDDFPPLPHVDDHFSIQESLTKNSDYIVKTSKYNQPQSSHSQSIQPIDPDETLNFNMMTLDGSVVEMTLPTPGTKDSSEQFFDTNTSQFDYDLSESVFAEPLAALEPFIDNFEQLTYKETSDEELMNFESPKQENASVKSSSIVASYEDDDDKPDTEMTTVAGGRSDNNSSDDTEDSYNEDKKEDNDRRGRQRPQNDDDELEPLISTATTSSDTTPNFSSKAIVDTLPDNNRQQQQETGNWPTASQNSKKKSRRKKR